MAKASSTLPALIFLLGLIACLELSVFTGGVMGQAYPCKTDEDCYIRRCRVAFWRLCINGNCECVSSPRKSGIEAASSSSTADVPPCPPSECTPIGDPPTTA